MEEKKIGRPRGRVRECQHMQLYLPTDLVAWVRETAQAEGRTYSRFVERLLRDEQRRRETDA